jgi:hypothetical protein
LRDWKGRVGYAAHPGERGVKLSGGQHQRVALARVILKNAPILVLDEATSALDSEVEAAIQEQLETLMHGKTVVAIAHRLSTIARMDRLVVMEAGRIVEQGTHDELLRAGGQYALLWKRQSGGFLANELPKVVAEPSDGPELKGASEFIPMLSKNRKCGSDLGYRRRNLHSADGFRVAAFDLGRLPGSSSGRQDGMRLPELSIASDQDGDELGRARTWRRKPEAGFSSGAPRFWRAPDPSQIRRSS